MALVFGVVITCVVTLDGGNVSAEPTAKVVRTCVEYQTLVLRSSPTGKCAFGSEFKQVWSTTKSSPILCVDVSTRVLTLAIDGLCLLPETTRAVPLTGKILIACAAVSKGVMLLSKTSRCPPRSNKLTWSIAKERTITVPTKRIAVCVDNRTLVLRDSPAGKCAIGAGFKLVWLVTDVSPKACIDRSTFALKLAPAGLCRATTSIPAAPTTGNTLIACADARTKLLRWSQTGICPKSNRVVSWPIVVQQPSVTWTSPASPSPSRTLSFKLTSVELLADIAPEDFSNAGTATGCKFTPSATSGTTIIIVVVCASDGTVISRLLPNVITDVAANTWPKNYTDAASVMIDATAPSATWIAPSTPSPTRILKYTLTFSELVSGIASADFSNAGTASGCEFTASTASAIKLTVFVTCTSDGTVIVRLGANTVTDVAGTTGPIANADAATVTVDTTDTTAPTASVNSATITTSGFATVRSTEIGTAYLVRNTVTIANVASITNASGTHWNSVSIATANTNTSLAATELDEGTYKVYAVDEAGNLSTASINSVIVDVTTPSVSSLSVSSSSGSDNVYVAGDTISLTIAFNEFMTVTGTPRIEIAGLTSKYATYVSGSTTASLLFSYTVVSDDFDSDGVAISANTLQLNGGTINDATGNVASLAHSAIAASAGHRVDAILPTVSSLSITSTATAGSTYIPGQTISVTIVWNETVTVTGTPRLTMVVGSTDKFLTYASGSTTTSLVFSYTAESGTTDTDGVSVTANTLSLNSGTIRDIGLNSATLAHSAIAASTSHKVDSTSPSATVTTATLSGAANSIAVAVVQSTEIGTAYLVVSTINVTNEASITSSGNTNFNSVVISIINSDTNLGTASLTAGTYKVYTTDAGGNVSVASTGTITIT